MGQRTEMIDVVDRNDRVIGAAPKKGIHDTNLRHRCAVIFLVDPDGRIWLEKRAMSKDVFPGYYNSSASGHIRHGETYLQGARREAYEELGIPDLKLGYRHKLEACPETLYEFIKFYTAESAERPRRSADAERLEAFTVRQIDTMIKGGERFVPNFLMLFKWYKENVLKDR